MITEADIRHWRRKVPWTEADQVEQDLVLSRLIVEIANHPVLGEELVFRGGTCLHKVWLDRPWRYSEDLDYVRRSSGGVGAVLSSVRAIADEVGFDRVQTAVGRQPKVRLDSSFAGGGRMRIKIEMNTFERSPARPIVRRRHVVESPWFTGGADVATFAIEELMATKIRALYQRRKGRDLFDLWLASEEAGVAPEAIADCFWPYRPDGWTPELALANLALKLDDTRFTDDLAVLVAQMPTGYKIERAAEAARRVIEAIAERS